MEPYLLNSPPPFLLLSPGIALSQRLLLSLLLLYLKNHRHVVMCATKPTTSLELPPCTDNGSASMRSVFLNTAPPFLFAVASSCPFHQVSCSLSPPPNPLYTPSFLTSQYEQSLCLLNSNGSPLHHTCSFLSSLCPPSACLPTSLFLHWLKISECPFVFLSVSDMSQGSTSFCTSI